MSYFIHFFDTNSEYNSAYHGSGYTEPWTGYEIENGTLSYNKTEYDYLKETPLTFEILSSGNITWYYEGDVGGKTIEYNKNNGTWTSCPPNTVINVSSGDTLQFRGNNDTYYDDEYGSSTQFSNGNGCQFRVKGNIMSLITSTGFTTATTLQSAYTFYTLFKNCNGLTDASNLVLPATTLANRCYSNMFRDCTNLTSASELPSTTLADRCYSNMFRGCTSLTSAPELPATTLANYCYQSMFYGCTSLTTAPELPATTLAEACYQRMFSGCTILNYIKCLATDISASLCTGEWVNGVAPSGRFVKAASMSSWTTGVNGIPTNWTIENA